MRCINTLKASFNAQGERTYSSKNAMAGLVALEFECRKCLPCRLNIAREKAIRCMHEASMHENNVFLTLTYDEKHLRSPKLVYADFQEFVANLRSKVDYRSKYPQKISYMVTGEYGTLNKRPHWHAILFNYLPPDAEYFRSTDRGEKVYRSAEIRDLWSRGDCEFGSVTMDSAGYVARYAAKKLVHGKDDEHEYDPVHKTSKGRAIGRSWIERYYTHTFQNGFVVLPNGAKSKIPRYYVDWAKKHQPDMWLNYVTNVRPGIIAEMEARSKKEEMDYFSEVFSRPYGSPRVVPRKNVKETILQSKFKQLQERLKL